MTCRLCLVVAWVGWAVWTTKFIRTQLKTTKARELFRAFFRACADDQRAIHEPVPIPFHCRRLFRFGAMGVSRPWDVSHSFNFDHRLRPETLRTAMATAFFWPTSTTSRLPRVTPV